MKKFLFIILLAIGFHANDIHAQADFTPCLPDCENDVWIPDITLPALKLEYVTLCGTDFIVRYRFRIACNQWYDYYIEGIESEGSAYDILDCINNGYGGNMALFLRAISEGLMIANPANFPPYTAPNCEDMWRVLKGGVSSGILSWVPGANR